MASRAESKRDPLRNYADLAHHAVMKEIARLAVAQGFTQDSLARKLGGGIRGGNIQRHFEAKRPRADTIRRYADVLGVRPEYLLLLHSHTFEESGARKKLRDASDQGERYWLNMLNVAFTSDEWEQGTDVAITEYLHSLPESERHRHLEHYALAYYREYYLGETVTAFFVARDAFEASAPAKLNLSQRRRIRIPGHMRFIKLFEEFYDVLDPNDFEVLLAVVRALLLKHGTDVAPMDSALHDDTLYRAWREGRLQGKVLQ